MAHRKKFIDYVKEGAIKGWDAHGILPSIAIAQAIHESAWGKSNLAQKANNLFGIKGEYNGQYVMHATREYQDNRWVNTRSKFKKYPNMAASVEDHGAFFTSSDWRKENYKDVIGEPDYKKAAHALSDAGYATDPDYARKVIQVIEDYNLTQYDNPLTKEKEGVKTMSKSIIIDPGHGGTDPGAVGFGVREKDWNLRISLYQYNRLKELGANVFITRTGDATMSSTARTNKIKSKYDYCVSNHWNAFNGSARGVETIHSIHGGKQFATDLANAIVKASGIPLRRVFSRRNNSGGDYYFMHRLTGTTRTVIIEYAFIDNRTDHNWYLNESNFYKAAEAVVEVMCKHVGVTYKTPGNTAPAKPAAKPVPVKEPISGKLYRVQAGAFSKKENAEKMHERMQNAGIDAFVLQDKNLYKVQAGAYAEKSNAEAQLKKVTAAVGDGFIVEVGNTQPIAKPKPAPKPAPAKKTVNQLINEVNAGLHGNGDARKKSLGSRYNEVQAEINRRAGSGSKKAAKTINTGSKVKIKSSASRYATGQIIPSSVKGKTYTVQQKSKRNGKNQVLLKEIVSWVWESDVQ